MNKADLITQARALLAKITPGEWRANMSQRWVEGKAFDGSWKFICAPRIHGGTPQQANANTEFIAAAPQLVADLCAALEASRVQEPDAPQCDSVLPDEASCSLPTGHDGWHRAVVSRELSWR